MNISNDYVMVFHQQDFTYLTFIWWWLGDVPGPPGPLRVEGIGDRVLRVWWTEPDPRGSPVTAYRVWGRPQHRFVLISSTVVVYF